MPIREDLLNPIPGENPGGKSLRYDPIYEKIKEARREEDNLEQGDWQHERKVADWPVVINLTQEAIAKQSKDLQLAAWLTEAFLVKEGFSGLRGGLNLIDQLINTFWDNLYPEIEDGDRELRAAPLSWVGTKLDMRLRAVPLNKAGHDHILFKESRAVGFEKDIGDDQKKKANREKMLKEGKLAPEDFDKSFEETPKAFYKDNEKELDSCLKVLHGLDELCQEKFGDDFPSFGPLTTALTEVRHAVHQLLEKKRETEPDPPEEQPAAEAGLGPVGEEGTQAVQEGAGGGILLARFTGGMDPNDPLAVVVNAAASLRKSKPYSPASYLMLRGWRWGELRAAVASSDPMALEAPPTELRRHLKSLAINGRWSDLLEQGEQAMGMPCGRAWLDLQRFVIQACNGLGREYDGVAKAVQSELWALLRDLPQLPQASLMDDSPAANAETQAWLRSLVEQVNEPEKPAEVDASADGWPRKPISAQDRAEAALKAGQEQKAFEIMHYELSTQRSGRGRFLCKLALADICLKTGKDSIAQIMLDDVITALENHKLEEWEDAQLITSVLLTLLKSSRKVQGDSSQKQRLFERICHLDPVQAMSLSI